MNAILDLLAARSARERVLLALMVIVGLPVLIWIAVLEPAATSRANAKQARDDAKAKMKQDTEEAKQQALDRKIRQRTIDLPRLENDLYLRSKKQDVKGLIQSKIARLEVLLDEFKSDKWLSNQLKDTDLAKQLDETRKAIEALRVAVENMKESS